MHYAKVYNIRLIVACTAATKCHRSTTRSATFTDSEIRLIMTVCMEYTMSVNVIVKLTESTFRSMFSCGANPTLYGRRVTVVQLQLLSLKRFMHVAVNASSSEILL